MTLGARQVTARDGNDCFLPFDLRALPSSSTPSQKTEVFDISGPDTNGVN